MVIIPLSSAQQDEKTVAPDLTFLSMMFGLGSDAGQSMEINAMAMKYLKDDQLTQIAKMRQIGGANSYSDAKIIQKVIGDMKLSTPEVSHFGISPNDMTIATRKYMERHGLLGENSNDLNGIYSLNHTIKLKTDFSLSCLGSEPINNKTWDRNESVGLATPKANQATPGSPFIRKDLGASPILMPPKHYNLGPGQTHDRFLTGRKGDQQRRLFGQGLLGQSPKCRRSSRANKINSDEPVMICDDQDEENILDIEKLKQLPKLL